MRRGVGEIMAYFAIHALDKPGMLATREALRPGHRARLRDHDFALTVRVGGPLTDAVGAMVGTLLIVEAEDFGEVERFFAGDPYAQAGIFERVDIRPFNWGLGLPEEAGRG